MLLSQPSHDRSTVDEELTRSDGSVTRMDEGALPECMPMTPLGGGDVRKTDTIRAVAVPGLYDMEVAVLCVSDPAG